MKQTISVFLAKVPTALGGLALAIASLGWCWENGADMHGQAQMLGALIATPLLILLLLKFIFNPKLLKEDISHHVAGSVLPTFAMATMIVANNINHLNHQVAMALWLAAICLHLLFLVVFVYYRLKDFKFHHVLPSWFIPPVGIVVAVVSFPGGQLLGLAQVLLLFGLIIYAFLLPTMLYRYFLHHKIADHEKPTIAVFAAPASLSLAGYLTITDKPSALMVLVLGGVAVCMTLFIYFALTKLLRLPFSPAYSSFTFPLVIGATAMFKTSQYLVAGGYDVQFIHLIDYVANVELLLATLMVAYVTLRYLMHFNPLRNARLSR